MWRHLWSLGQGPNGVECHAKVRTPSDKLELAITEVDGNQPVGQEPGKRQAGKGSLRGERSCLGRFRRTKQKKGYQLQRVETSSEHHACSSLGGTPGWKSTWKNLMTLGHHSSNSMKLLAAVLHVCPWMGKQSQKGLLRACRGLGGWIKKRLSWSCVPQPFEVLTAIANRMVIHGRNDMVLFLLIAWSSYARPNQLLLLQTQFLLKPGPACDHWCLKKRTSTTSASLWITSCG